MAVDTKMRSRPQRLPKHIRISSLSQRSYHKEPYPATPKRDVDPSPGALLPTPSTSSPRRHSSVSSFVPRVFQPSPSVEPRKPSSVLGFLVLYFCLNLFLTLYNKLVLVRFPFPYTLTALHALAGTLGAHILVHSPSLGPRVSLHHLRPLSIRNLSITSLLQHFHVPPVFARYTWRFRRVWRRITSVVVGAKEHRPLSMPTSVSRPDISPSSDGEVSDPFYSSTHSGMQTQSSAPLHRQPFSERLAEVPRPERAHMFQKASQASRLDLTFRETLVIMAFSVLYTVNIVVSNLSLGLVTVPFHQVVRSSTPFFTIALSIGIMGQRASKAKIMALVPVIVGVGFATYGDYYFTPWGFALTLLGTLLAALKTVITHVLQSSTKFSQPNSTMADRKPEHVNISPNERRCNSLVNAPSRAGSPWYAYSSESTGMPDGTASGHQTHRHDLTLSDLIPSSPTSHFRPSLASASSFPLLPNDSRIGSRQSLSPSASGNLGAPFVNGSSPDSSDRAFSPSLSFKTSSSGSSIFIAPSPSPSFRIFPSSPLASNVVTNPPTFAPVHQGNTAVRGMLSRSNSDPPLPVSSSFISSPPSPPAVSPVSPVEVNGRQALLHSNGTIDRDEQDRSDLQAFRFPRAITPPPPYSLTDSASDDSMGIRGPGGRASGSDFVSQWMSFGSQSHMDGDITARATDKLAPSTSSPNFAKDAVEQNISHQGLLRPLSPLDLLLLTSPLAFIQCVLIAHFSGELDRVRHYSQHEMNCGKTLALLANGLIAFGLNVVSFTANKKIGALGMSVAANVKQVLTILIAVVIFELRISGMNALGIMLTLFGGAWYATVEYDEKLRRTA